MKMKKIASMILATAMILTLGACGSDAGTASTPAPDSSSSTGDAAAETSTTPTLDAIREKGEITMMTATGFPPYEYLGPTGQPAGVDIDLSQLVADALGVELKVIDMDFGLLVEALKSGKGDLVAAGMTATPEREMSIDFSLPYVQNSLVLLVPVDSDITSVDQIAGKTLTIQESTTAHIYAMDELGINDGLAFKTTNECASALMGGKADVSIMDILPAKSLAGVSNGTLKVIEEPITLEQTVMGIAKGEEDLVEFVNSVLEKALADGVIDELIEKHIEIAGEG